MKTLDDLIGEFSDWWILGGDDSRFIRFKLASQIASSSFGDLKDLDSLSQMIDLNCQHLGLCSEWLPEAEAFLQASLGLATEEALPKRSDNPKLRPSTSQEKMIIEGRVVEVQKVVRSIERLSATINHRLDALRSILSTEKERMRSDMGRISQGSGNASQR